MMKRTMIITLIAAACTLLFTSGHAADYYVSATGNDNNSGLSAAAAWQTLTKVNNELNNLQSGDRVLFQRGDTFYGSLNITASNLIFGAYGSGNAPRLDAGTLISGWAAVGSNTWEANCPTCGNDINALSIDDEFQRFARFPNFDAEGDSYLYFESHNDNLSITDNELTNSPNWTGAEVVVRNKRWKLDRRTAQHSGNTISFQPALSADHIPLDNFGYFFQNHPNALDQAGEFTYDATTKKFRIIYGENPNNVTIATSHTQNVVSIINRTNITFENLEFSRGLTDNIYIQGSNGVTFNNCVISHAATNGIKSINSSNISVLNSLIQNIQNNGIDFKTSDNIEIAYSEILNIAFMAGMGQGSDTQYNGIIAYGNGINIHHNRLVNIGYIAIDFRGSDATVTNNFINNFCFVKDDGAGIYTWNNASGTGSEFFSNQVIENNIIINGVGAGYGTDDTESSKACGIYIDDGSDDILIQNNVAAKNTWAGIMIHNSGTQTISNNLVYDNDIQLLLLEDNISQQDIREIVVENNCFVSTTIEQSSIEATTSGTDLLPFGTYDNNYYAAPLGTGGLFNLSYRPDFPADPGVRKDYVGLDAWQQFTGQDASSTTGAITLSPYTFNQYTSSNLALNGSFDTNVSDWSTYAPQNNQDHAWDNTNQLTDGSARFYFNSLSSVNSNYLVAQNTIGALSAGNTYILEFDSKSNNPDAFIQVTTGNGNAPYQVVEPFQYQALNTSATSHTVAMQISESFNQNIIRFRLNEKWNNNQGINQMYLDNVVLREADVTWKTPEEHIIFLYNDNDDPGSFPLSGNYNDVKGNSYSGSIELAAWSGAVLILEACVDSDNDGVCDTDDVCANFDDSIDADNDGVPDACDACPSDPSQTPATTVTIRAKGDEGLEQMTLQINGVDVTSWVVTTNWQDYTYQHHSNINELRVFLSNQQQNPALDYNLHIDYTIIGDTQIETDAPETYGEGVLIDGNFCGSGYAFTTEVIYCIGYIEYLTLPECLFTCLDFSLNVLFEGAYNAQTQEMSAALYSRKLLPGQIPPDPNTPATPPGQPYNIAPWNYSGAEGADFTEDDYDSNVIDWILLSIRTNINKSDEVAKVAALLMNDGTVQTVSGCPLITDETGPFYIVVEHRNQMAMMSPVLVPVVNGVLTYDFTTQDSYKSAASAGQKELSPGVWAMFAGDMDQASDVNGYQITGQDKTIWNPLNGSFNIYHPGDVNLNGDVNGGDKGYWALNNGISSIVPK